MMSISENQGFSLVPALFLLVVLGVLGAVAVRVNMIEQQTVVLTMQSSRALAAARAGIERAAYLASSSGTCVTDTFNLSEGGLAGFTVQTSCQASAHTEGSTTVNIYQIDAFASSGVFGSPDYVSRRVRATVSDAL
jgi:MSHA biogenesis protein MshP